MTLAILVSAIQIRWDDPNYLFLGLVATVAVVALAQSSPGWMRRLAAGRWPKTAGRIETASARHVPHFRSRWSSKEDPCEWTGILTYSYRVNGTSYSGTYNREFTYEAQADDFLRGLVDQPMPVSFNPAKPSESLVFEAEVDALIAAQHPSNDETPPQQTIVSPLMGWGRILLWMLAIVEGTAGAALLLIFYTYRNAAWQPVEWSRPLGKGAWAAAIISLVVWQVVQVRAGSAGYFWKTALAECRRWGGILVVTILWNVFFNLLPFLNPFDDDTSSRWDGLMNGRWGTNPLFLAILYSGSALILWQVAQAGPRRCASGHWVRRGNAMCPRCGAPVAR